ncbi:MAG: AAA family ATPase [Clostridia bacterium]|nr:AAA family ATPase [Clostridia bacterium]
MPSNANEKRPFIEEIIEKTTAEAARRKHSYILPEHLLFAFKDDEKYVKILGLCSADKDLIDNFIETFLDSIPADNIFERTSRSAEFTQVLEEAAKAYTKEFQEKPGMVELGIRHILMGVLTLDPGTSSARHCLEHGGVTQKKLEQIDDGDEPVMAGGEDVTPEDKDLAKYAVNMNERARKGKYSKLIGRQEELARMIQILHKKRACNPVLLGNSGSGKTAIVEGLVQKIVAGDVPEGLKDAKVWSVNVGSLLAGSKFRGEFEERLQKIIKKVTEDSNVIIFFDEIHTICGAGSAGDSALDASNILKPYLTDHAFRCIGATTYDEYRLSIEKDKALSRRFKKIDVKEPSESETVEIMMGLKPEYEAFHQVTYTDEAIKSIVKLTGKFLTEQYFPDKAIEVMDEAGARFRSGLSKCNVVDVVNIEELVAKMANVKSVAVRNDDKKLLLSLAADLKREIYNQDDAIDKVVRHLKIAKAGLGRKEKPLCVYGLVGNSGTGKTELAKQVADRLGLNFIRFDMSEYAEAHTVAKLIGAPPGYVGHDEPGLLTETVRRNPNSVVLFDEIEKANPSIYNLLLQMMDEGHLTDSKGVTVSFTSTVIFMTSNAGSRNASFAKSSIGFQGKKDMEEVFANALRDCFPTEFRNRFTEILRFNDLDMAAMEKIVDKEIRRLNFNLCDQRVTVKLDESARAFIAEKAMEENMGGRPVERLVNAMVAEPMVDDLLTQAVQNSCVLFRKVGDGLEYTTEKRNENGKTESTGGERVEIIA